MYMKDIEIWRPLVKRGVKNKLNHLDCDSDPFK